MESMLWFHTSIPMPPTQLISYASLIHECRKYPPFKYHQFHILLPHFPSHFLHNHNTCLPYSANLYWTQIHSLHHQPLDMEAGTTVVVVCQPPRSIGVPKFPNTNPAKLKSPMNPTSRPSAHLGYSLLPAPWVGPKKNHNTKDRSAGDDNHLVSDYMCNLGLIQHRTMVSWTLPCKLGLLVPIPTFSAATLDFWVVNPDTGQNNAHFTGAFFQKWPFLSCLLNVSLPLLASL